MGTKKTAATAASILATTLTASLFSVTAQAASPSFDGTVFIPQRVALKQNVVGRSLTDVFDLGNYAGTVASVGQYCDTTDNGATGTEPEPIGGRWWTWSTPAYDRSVDQVVTVWADADSAFSDVVFDTGYCRYTAMDYPGFESRAIDQDVFLATWAGQAVVTRKVDRSLVSIRVRGPESSDALVNRALTLSAKAVKQVDAANLGAQGRGR